MTITLETKRWDEVNEDERLGVVTMDITMRRLMMNVIGTRDLNPIHHDRDFASRNGARDIFVNTMFYEGLFGRLATDWAGPEAYLRRMKFAMKQPNCLGDSLTSRGWVVRKYLADGVKLVDLEIHLDNQLGSDTTIAELTIELPV